MKSKFVVENKRVHLQESGTLLQYGSTHTQLLLCMQPNCGKVSNGNVLFDTFCTKLTTFKTHAKLASGQARWLHAEIRCLILKPIRAQKESHASVTLDNLEKKHICVT